MDTGELAERTYLVTGANTGIGRATAEDLARRGGRVVLAGRSEEATRAVMAAITATTGNDDLDFLALDLADLDSAHAAARALHQRGEPIDVLIANAGVAGQRGETAQGWELAFGVNHLGHFLFVTSVLDLLTPGARVVVVASQAHADADDLDEAHLRGRTRSITGLPEYARSKLANVLFAQELARRHDPATLTTYALHPGVIASDIWRRIPWPIRPIMTRAMTSTEEGARTSLWCATDPALAGATGRYYDDCAEKEPSPLATPELGAWLWERSEAWTAEWR